MSQINDTVTVLELWTLYRATGVGYLARSTRHWSTVFISTVSLNCEPYCANPKTAIEAATETLNPIYQLQSNNCFRTVFWYRH